MSLLCKWRRLIAAAACFVVLNCSLHAGDEIAPAKEITVKGLTGRGVFGKRGNVSKPTVIENALALAEAVKNEELREAIKKQVNFVKQKLVFFRWAGSGQDKLAFAIRKNDAGKTTVIFLYRPGRTRDLRPHAKLYAVSRDVSWLAPKRKLRRGE